MAMEINDATFAPSREAMEKCISFMNEELVHIRVGRADPRLLDRVSVPYYGVPTPLNQVANVQVAEARQLLIQPWDQSLLKEIEKAVLDSDIGITPMNDGKAIRLNFPMLTEERRRELGKKVQKLGEECKICVRNVRRDFLDTMKKHLKKNEISEDQYRGCEEEIQKIIDKESERIDREVEAKEKDLMEI